MNQNNFSLTVIASFKKQLQLQSIMRNKFYIESFLFF